jgi:hypothetical protein|tara:strand:- start:106 stop:354 length:249 start_codon:yes stop_codon:yes gene_type:complete
MTLELFHHLIKVDEYGKARMIAIKLKFSEQVIEDAIRYKKEQFKKNPQTRGAYHQLKWHRFWNASDFRRKDKWLKEHIRSDL